MENKKKINIYCPICRRKAFEIPEGCGLVMQKKCTKCNRLVDYNPRYGVRALKTPDRCCSSGRRFY